MRISDMLNAIASWLESPDNEAILLAEYDEDCLQVVANSCVQAAALLKVTADTVEDIEPKDDSNITPESLDELANLATAFDESGDPELKKQATVIDELLLTIAAPPDAMTKMKSLADEKIDALKKKYDNPGDKLDKKNKVADSIKDIEKSNMTKSVNINGNPLSTRTCPDHPGVQISRVGDQTWQCDLDKKVYNFEEGFTLNDGTVVPGGSVSNQTQFLDRQYHSMFDTREERLVANK